MKTVWVKGLDDKASDEMRQEFVHSVHVRKRLEELLIEKYQVNTKESRAKANYDNPSWAYLQADARGYERAIFEVISLISHLDV